MDNRQAYRLIVDLWRFWQGHSDACEADGWWDALIRDADAFWLRHGKSDASRKLITTILKIIEDEYGQVPSR